MRLPSAIGLCILIGLFTGCGDTGTSEPEPSCEGVTCSGHGTCSIAGAEAACTCDAGFAGADCSACADGYTRAADGGCAPLGPCVDNGDCGEHGICDERTGQAVCVCDPGWAGAACDTCAGGYEDDGEGGCALLPPTCQADSCSGHGTCDDADGDIICDCDPGYDGMDCGRCADGYEDDGAGGCAPLSGQCTTQSCSGHGSCDDSSGSFVCTCLPGYQGARCDHCVDGYHLTPLGDCEEDVTCAEFDPCSIHGTCQDEGGSTYCVCDAGFAGSTCDDCAEGYHPDPIEGCAVDESCPDPDPCAPGGTCDDTGGIVTCVCQPEYTGDLCESCAPGFVDHDGVCEQAANCQEYPFEHVAYMHQIAFAPADPPCCHDLTGDGEPDNAFGAVVDLLGSLDIDANAALQQQIENGDICRLFEFRALDSAVDDAEMSLVFFGCDDLDGDYADNLSGQEPFSVPADWFEPDGAGGCSPFPLAPFDSAEVTGGVLQAQASELFGLPLPIPADQGAIASFFAQAVVADADLQEDGNGAAAVAGRLSGGIPLAEWFGAYNAFTQANCDCLQLDGPLFSWEIDPDEGFVVSCADSSFSVCSDVGTEGTCQQMATFCAYGGVFTGIADLDLDGDGINDAMSFAVQFESVPAVAQGISP